MASRPRRQISYRLSLSFICESIKNVQQSRCVDVKRKHNDVVTVRDATLMDFFSCKSNFPKLFSAPLKLCAAHRAHKTHCNR